MKKVLIRRISVIAAAAVIIGSVAINKYLVAQKEPPKQEAKINTTPLVKTLTIKHDSLINTINLNGRLIASEKVEIFSEVTGTLRSTGKQFKEGERFSKG